MGSHDKGPGRQAGPIIQGNPVPDYPARAYTGLKTVAGQAGDQLARNLFHPGGREGGFTGSKHAQNILQHPAGGPDPRIEADPSKKGHEEALDHGFRETRRL